MDVFTRLIRGWHLSRNLDQGLTLAALERALVVATPKIHHSDQGVQYAATASVNRLKKLHVKLSMAAVGEPRENGYAERLMRTIKEEGRRSRSVGLQGLRRGPESDRLLHRCGVQPETDSLFARLSDGEGIRDSRSNGGRPEPGLQQRRPERRIGQRWEPTRAPSQGPMPMGESRAIGVPLTPRLGTMR